MKILVVATHYPVASGRYAFNALKRLGHDVRSAGPSTGNYLPWGGGVTVEDDYIWTPDAPEKGWAPQLVIHMDGNLTPQNVDGALHVVYGVDNHVRDYAFIDGRRKTPFPFDHLFLGHANGARIGEPHVTYIGCAYDPTFFTPGPKWEQRQYDAVLLGVMYPQRAELLYALREGLPHLSMIYGQSVYEKFAAAHHASKLSIVRSANNDVAQRVWETAAMGCLVIKDANDDDERLGLVDGENCLIYRTNSEAVEKVRWALAHQDAAEVMAQAGQAWAQPGTWDARLNEIVEWAAAQMGAGKAART